MRAAGLVAIFLLLAGCSGPGGLCREGTPAEGERGICFVSGSHVVRGGVRGADGPIVLLVHGAGEDRGAMDALSRRIADAGMIAVSFDLRGHGETTRGGERGDPAKFSSAEWNAMVSDVEGASNWSKSALGARPSAVVGASVGANLALRHAVARDVPVAVLLSPGTQYKGVTAADVASDFEGRVFLLASAADAPSAEAARRLNATMTAASERRLVVLPGDAHGSGLLEDDEVVRAVAAFIPRR